MQRNQPLTAARASASVGSPLNQTEIRSAQNQLENGIHIVYTTFQPIPSRTDQALILAKSTHFGLCITQSKMGRFNKYQNPISCLMSIQTAIVIL